MNEAQGELVNLFAPCLGAYSPRTLRGYMADLAVFIEWCRRARWTWLPADPLTIASFVDDQVSRYCISTIKRRLCAIAFAHRVRDLPSPVDAQAVRLAVRRASRTKPSRPKQVGGLTNAIRLKILNACPKTLAGVRDAALISVGYDTLCRSSEIAAMRVEHVTIGSDGTAMIIIPRSKSDAAGNGRVAYLSPETTTLLKRWLEEAPRRKGPLFRSLHLGRVSDQSLDTSSIRRLIKRATKRAGLDLSSRLSGHSMRIGAAQDMLVAGFDAIAIMQAGGWKSANVVLRYVENAATKELHEKRWRSLNN